MDELWTLWHVTQLRSVGEIFSRFVHDNNHPLNSLWMYLVAPLKTDWVYRLLSWMGGTAAVWLAAKIARLQFLRLHPKAPADQTRVAEWITAALFGSSYLLVVYSSEARGYGPALGFGLLGVYALLRAPAIQPGIWVFVFWIASILSVLSHAVSYQLLAGAFVFTVVQGVQQKAKASDILVSVSRWHALPVMFGVVYYFLFFRKLEIVGGPETPLSTVLGELAAYSIGFPVTAGVTLALPLLIAAVIFALAMQWRRSPAIACFHAMAMVLFPAAALAFSPFVYLFPRYFILSAASALLLVGYLGARMWNAGRIARMLLLFTTSLIVIGNAVHTSQLLRHGRGEYKSALRYIAERTPAGPITISSDNDGRNVLLVYHHAPGAIQPRSMEYLPLTRRPAEGAQWLLVHRLEHDPVPGAEMLDERGNPYRLEKAFAHAPLSGWDWYVYRNIRLLP